MKTNLALLIALTLCLGFFSTNNFLFATDNWISTGNLLYPLQDHTATLLQNGKVLIAGYNWQREAELFDPETNNFSVTDSTVYHHSSGGSATLLNNGKVLLVGGRNGQKYAELYNPDSGIFEPVDSLNGVHCYHTATLLADGRVLIAGGQDAAQGVFSGTVIGIDRLGAKQGRKVHGISVWLVLA